MKTKWYACALLIVFIFLGTFQENTTVPNQEIVIEFVDLKTSEKEITNTIYSVKESLLKAGASNIEVEETKNGALKISYYSIVNVANIKEVLSKNNSSTLKQHPLENKEEKQPSPFKVQNYSLDIYELNQDIELANFDSNSILEIKFDSRRHSNTQNFASLENIQLKEAHKVFKTAFKIQKRLLIIKDNTSHLKPEVRAGPLS